MIWVHVFGHPVPLWVVGYLIFVAVTLTMLIYIEYHNLRTWPGLWRHLRDRRVARERARAFPRARAQLARAVK